MSPQLSALQIVVLAAYAVGMAAGQVLFKLAALRDAADLPLLARLLALAHNLYFIAALAAYLVLSAVWVWILSFTPLSRAYPFVALAFAMTSLLGSVLFAEPLTLRLMVGLGVILCGLLLVTG